MTGGWRAALAAALLLLTTAPGAARAHGPAPAVIEVVRASETGEADLVLTNIGLLRRQPDGAFVYRCPSEWDDDGDGEYDEVAPRVAAPEGAVLVAGDPDLYRATADACAFTALAEPAGVGPSTLALFADGAKGWALIDEGDTRALFALDDASADPLLRTEVPLTAGGRSGPGQAVLFGMDHTGASPRVAWWTVDLATGARTEELLEPPPDTEPQRARWRFSLDDTRWLSVATSSGTELWKRQGSGPLTRVQAATGALLGPVPLCGGVVWAADGSVVTDPDLAPTCATAPLEALDLRCLTTAGGASFACDVFDLVALRTDGGELAVSPAFAFRDVVPPDTSCLDDEARARCEAAFVHFGAEAGLLPEGWPALPEPDAEPEPDVGPSCSFDATETRTSPWPGILAAVGLLRRRRSRATA